MCRNSGVSTSSKPPTHFSDDYDFFEIDRHGEPCDANFECPATLSEMLAISHVHNTKRNSTLAEMRKTYTPVYETPVMTTKKNNYDMFCSPSSKSISREQENDIFADSADDSDANKQMSQSSVSAVTNTKRNHDMDDIFGDSDEE